MVERRLSSSDSTTRSTTPLLPPSAITTQHTVTQHHALHYAAPAALAIRTQHTVTISSEKHSESNVKLNIDMIHQLYRRLIDLQSRFPLAVAAINFVYFNNYMLK